MGWVVFILGSVYILAVGGFLLWLLYQMCGGPADKKSTEIAELCDIIDKAERKLAESTQDMSWLDNWMTRRKLRKKNLERFMS